MLVLYDAVCLDYIIMVNPFSLSSIGKDGLPQVILYRRQLVLAKGVSICAD